MELTITQNGALYALHHRDRVTKKYRGARKKRVGAGHLAEQDVASRIINARLRCTSDL
jgi:hypothetical protein